MPPGGTTAYGAAPFPSGVFAAISVGLSNFVISGEASLEGSRLLHAERVNARARANVVAIRVGVLM